MIELTRLLYAVPTVIRADVIMNPVVMLWDAIGGRGIAIALIVVVIVVTLLLLWLLKRKK